MVDHSYQTEIACIVMHDKDNVATLLRDVRQGEVLSFEHQGIQHTVEMKGDIQFGHKFALSTISKGETIVKYGEVIGAATETIETGQHVHVHNLEGLRGRGDQQTIGEGK